MTKNILLNVLRGAGSIISVNGALSARPTLAARRSIVDQKGLENDFHRIAGDLRKCVKDFESEKAAHV